jgi:fatty acid desaturase
MATANFYGALSKSNAFDRFLAKHILPYQTRYYFFILGLARFSWAIQSLFYSFENETLNKSKILSWCERLFLVAHWVFFTAVTIAWTSTWKEVVLFFVASQLTTGYLLAIVFAMNHNGMPVLTPEEATNMEFYEIQVVTGRDVSCSAVGDWIFGGLNYQIEHHVSLIVL